MRGVRLGVALPLEERSELLKRMAFTLEGWKVMVSWPGSSSVARCGLRSTSSFRKTSSSPLCITSCKGKAIRVTHQFTEGDLRGSSTHSWGLLSKTANLHRAKRLRVTLVPGVGLPTELLSASKVIVHVTPSTVTEAEGSAVGTFPSVEPQ